MRLLMCGAIPGGDDDAVAPSPAKRGKGLPGRWEGWNCRLRTHGELVLENVRLKMQRPSAVPLENHPGTLGDRPDSAVATAGPRKQR